MRGKLFGYIVIADGYVCERSRHRDHVGVLFIGAGATVFPTRADAKRAIRLSVEYATRRQLPWADADYSIRQARKP